MALLLSFQPGTTVIVSFPPFLAPKSHTSSFDPSIILPQSILICTIHHSLRPLTPYHYGAAATVTCPCFMECSPSCSYQALYLLVKDRKKIRSINRTPGRQKKLQHNKNSSHHIYHRRMLVNSYVDKKGLRPAPHNLSDQPPTPRQCSSVSIC